MRSAATVAFWMAVHGTAACRAEAVFVELDPDLNRMLEQPRVDPYESPIALAIPPVGTEPYVPIEASPLYDPTVAGAFVATIPFALDRSLLERGRAHFETFCAACHGVLGTGISVPAQFMGRRPPSLHEQRLRELAAGDLYLVIQDGYGLMPGYASQIANQDRWAVVAYVQTLQLSQNVVLAALPAESERRIRQELP